MYRAKHKKKYNKNKTSSSATLYPDLFCKS